MVKNIKILFLGTSGAQMAGHLVDQSLPADARQSNRRTTAGDLPPADVRRFDRRNIFTGYTKKPYSFHSIK